jgi:hypothetical protein
MNTNAITVEVPDSLDMKEWEVRMTLAAHLYADGKVTAGQGAAMVEMTKQTFIEMLGKFDVNYFNQTPEELEEEIWHGVTFKKATTQREARQYVKNLS